MHGGAAAAAAQEALLLDEPPRHGEGVLVPGLDPPVHHAAVQHRGDEVVPGALHVVVGHVRPVEVLWLGQDGAQGVHPHHLAGRALLLDLAADAGDGAAGAGPQHHHVHAAAALLEDLLRRGVVVRQRVAGVAVLVQDDRVRDLGQEPLRQSEVSTEVT